MLTRVLCLLIFHGKQNSYPFPFHPTTANAVAFQLFIVYVRFVVTNLNEFAP